jgi:shikimate kinase
MTQPVFVIGFMGSGKSTFGKKLATKLGYGFIDLDEEVVKLAGKSISEIIEQEGEEKFRQLENTALKGLDISNKVISTGGGTPCFYDNIEWMKEHGLVVYLNVPEGVIYSRLKTTDLTQRPLLKGLDDDGLKQFIHTKLEERLPYYYRAKVFFNPVNTDMEYLVRLVA